MIIMIKGDSLEKRKKKKGYSQQVESGRRCSSSFCCAPVCKRSHNVRSAPVAITLTVCVCLCVCVSGA